MNVECLLTIGAIAYCYGGLQYLGYVALGNLALAILVVVIEGLNP